MLFSSFIALLAASTVVNGLPAFFKREPSVVAVALPGLEARDGALGNVVGLDRREAVVEQAVAVEAAAVAVEADKKKGKKAADKKGKKAAGKKHKHKGKKHVRLIIFHFTRSLFIHCGCLQDNNNSTATDTVASNSTLVDTATDVDDSTATATDTDLDATATDTEASATATATASED